MTIVCPAPNDPAGAATLTVCPALRFGTGPDLPLIVIDGAESAGPLWLTTTPNVTSGTSIKHLTNLTGVPPCSAFPDIHVRPRRPYPPGPGSQSSSSAAAVRGSAGELGGAEELPTSA